MCCVYVLHSTCFDICLVHEKLRNFYVFDSVLKHVYVMGHH